MMEMMAPAIANFAGGLGKGLGDAIGGGGGPMVSGGDARSAFDGSGWTVSTGSSRATGGARTGGADLGGAAASPFGFGGGQVSQAGFGWLPALLLLGVALAWKAGK